MICCTNFQDENEHADVLGLMPAITAVLNEETMREDAPLVFLDVRNFAGGVHIVGRYTTEGGRTKVKFRLRRDGQWVSDWVELEGTTDDLPARIVQLTIEKLPGEEKQE